MGAMPACGIVPRGVGGNEGLRFGKGAAIVFEVEGNELIAGRVGVGSTDVLTTDNGEEDGWEIAA